MEDAAPLSARSRAATKRNRELGHRPTRSKHQLTLNAAAFTEFMTARGKTSHTEIAAYLEVGVGTIYRALDGEPIGAGFVSALAKKVGNRTHLQRFLVADEKDAEPVTEKVAA